MQKVFRKSYFAMYPHVKAIRALVGPAKFDAMYRSIYAWLSKLYIGQYFRIADLCKRDPDNHDLVLLMCDIYANMDLYVDLEWNEETDMVTIKQPRCALPKGQRSYWPPDVYSRIIKDPKGWGIEPSDILTEDEIALLGGSG